MRRSLLTLAVALLGCGPRTGPGAQLESPEPPAAAQGSAALTSAAAKIEVGRLEPLLSSGPQWGAEALGVQSVGVAQAAVNLTQARDALMAAERAGRVTSPLVLDVVATAWTAEALVLRGEISVELLEGLERAYSMFDQPAYRLLEQSRREAVLAFAAAINDRGISLTERQLAEADRLIASVADGAGAAQLGIAKLLLQNHAERPGTADVAVRSAAALVGVQDAVAVELVQASVAPGATTSGDPSAALAGARVCYRTLAISCAEAALQQARVSGTERAAIDKLAGQAARALELRDRADLDSRVELGELYLELRRDDDARAVFETAHTQHPEDARPVGGLAKHAIMTRADFRGAYQLLERSGATENRDRSYYEVAIGTRAVSLAYDVMPRAAAEGGGLAGAAASVEPYYRRLRADVLAYRDLGVPEAEVLLFVLDGVFEILPRLEDKAVLRERLSGLLPRAKELQQAAPTHAPAYRLLLLAAAFSTDREASLSVVRAEPAPALLVGDTGPRRVAQWLDLALRWEAYGELPAIEAAVNEVGVAASDPRLAAILGVISAVRARLGQRAEWQTAAGYFNAALEGQPELVTANNLAVALHELGRTDEALALFGQLGTPGNRAPIVEFNAAVAAADRSSLTASCEGAADEASVLACRWLEREAKTAADKKRWALRSAEAETQARSNAIRSAPIAGQASALPKGEFNFNMNYAPLVGLDLGISVTTSAWLVLSP